MTKGEKIFICVFLFALAALVGWAMFFSESYNARYFKRLEAQRTPVGLYGDTVIEVDGELGPTLEELVKRVETLELQVKALEVK